MKCQGKWFNSHSSRRPELSTERSLQSYWTHTVSPPPIQPTNFTDCTANCLITYASLTVSLFTAHDQTHRSSSRQTDRQNRCKFYIYYKFSIIFAEKRFSLSRCIFSVLFAIFILNDTDCLPPLWIIEHFPQHFCNRNRFLKWKKAVCNIVLPFHENTFMMLQIWQ